MIKKKTEGRAKEGIYSIMLMDEYFSHAIFISSSRCPDDGFRAVSDDRHRVANGGKKPRRYFGIDPTGSPIIKNRPPVEFAIDLTPR